MNSAYPSLNFNLGDDIDMLRDSVFQFCAKEIAPRAAEIDSNNDFPVDLWRKLGDMGLLGITVNEEYGGTGMGYLAHAVAMEEISRASASVGLSYGAHSNLCVNQLHKNGSEEQKQKYLRATLAAEILWCQLFSEPGSGSDLVSLSTRAEDHGDEWQVSGQKVWSSTAQLADHGILLARTNPEEPGHRGISFFLFDMHGPGIDVRPLKQMTGDHEFCEVFLDDAPVAKADLLGPLHGGWGVATSVLGDEHITKSNMSTSNVFSRSYPNSIMIIGINGYTSNRITFLIIKNRYPSNSCIGRLPYPARAYGCIHDVLIFGINGDVRDPT